VGIDESIPAERHGLLVAVLNSTGAVVPQAKLVATNTGTGVQRETVTTESGDYLFGNLPPGTYTVHVSAPGFREVRSDAITLAAQQIRRFNAHLDIGTTTEAINVLEGSGLTNLNIGFMKNFHLGERAKFQLRAAATVALNHPAVAQPEHERQQQQLRQYHQRSGFNHEPRFCRSRLSRHRISRPHRLLIGSK